MVTTFITEQGGVGKTSLCFHLSWYLAEKGKKVLMIDLDAQRGNLSYYAGIPNRDDKKGIFEVLQGEVSIKETICNVKENIDIIPANENAMDIPILLQELLKRDQKINHFAKLIEEVKDNYDFIFIDINPTPSNLHFETLFASDNIVIPLFADGKSIAGTIGIVETYLSVKKEKKDLDILSLVYNKYDKRTVLTRTVNETMNGYCNGLNIPIAKTTIPNSVAMAESVIAHVGITELAPKNKVAVALRDLSKELFGI